MKIRMVIIGSSILMTAGDSALISKTKLARTLHFRLFAFIAAFMILFISGLAAQTDEEPLTVYGGAILFDNPDLDSLVLLEFPFVLSRHEFEFFQADSSDTNWYARIYAQVRLLSYDGIAVDSNSVYFTTIATTPEEVVKKGIRLFNNVSLLVKAGIYSARLTVIDVVSKREGQFFYEKIMIEPGQGEKIRLGGTCLAHSISYVGDKTSNANNRLVKNGFNVLVNPLRVYNVSDESLFFYGELYNLKYSIDSSSKYRLGFALLDVNDKLLRDFGFKSVVKPGKTAVIVEELDISGRHQGNYKLRVAASDEVTGDADTAILGFRIMAPNSLFFTGRALSEVDSYDTLSVRVKINLVKYMLTPAESQLLGKLDEKGKLSFLNQYWMEKDPTPGTNNNELRQEKLKRYKFANESFSYNVERDNGWQSDRGRIYITHGPWDRKKDVDLSHQSFPFEVWYYYGMLEGVVFVFQDLEAFYDKTLIHSNARGEIYNQAWDEVLKDLDILEDL